MNLLRIFLLLLLSSPLLKAQGWLRFPPDTVQSYSTKERAWYTGSAFIDDEIYVAIKLRKWDLQLTHFYEVYDLNGNLKRWASIPSDSLFDYYLDHRVVWNTDGDYLIYQGDFPSFNLKRFNSANQLVWSQYFPFNYNYADQINQFSFLRGNILLRKDSLYQFLNLNNGNIDSSFSLKSFMDSASLIIPMDSSNHFPRRVFGNVSGDIYSVPAYQNGGKKIFYLYFNKTTNRFKKKYHVYNWGQPPYSHNISKSEFSLWKLLSKELKGDSLYQAHFVQITFDGDTLRDFILEVQGYRQSQAQTDYDFPTIHFHEDENQNLAFSYSISRPGYFQPILQMDSDFGFHFGLLDKSNSIIYRRHHWGRFAYGGIDQIWSSGCYQSAANGRATVHIASDHSVYMISVNTSPNPDIFSRYVIQKIDSLGYSPLSDPPPIPLDKLQIFPNPSTGNIRIEGFKSRSKYVLSLFNLQGQLILQQDHAWADYKELEINVAAGIYFLRVQEGNNQKTFRLLIAD